jgi:hypothetical protein
MRTYQRVDVQDSRYIDCATPAQIALPFYYYKVL